MDSSIDIKINKNTVFLHKFGIDFSLSDFLKQLRIDNDNSDGIDYFTDVVKIYNDGKKIAMPKAVYKVAYIEDRGDNWVVIEGIRFESRILSLNLKDVHRVFPYIVTCGKELNLWAKSFNDAILAYWADVFCEMALREMFKDMNRDFGNRINAGKTAIMNPGSLEDWPISEQKKLFDLMKEEALDIGVELSESFLMIPVKSMSGMKFQTEFNYENCMLCPREKWPGRRAKYDPEAFKKGVAVI